MLTQKERVRKSKNEKKIEKFLKNNLNDLIASCVNCLNFFAIEKIKLTNSTLIINQTTKSKFDRETLSYEIQNLLYF